MTIFSMPKMVETSTNLTETQNLHDVISALSRQVLKAGVLANETGILLNRISPFNLKDIPQPPVDDNQGCIAALLFWIDRLKDVKDKAEANLTHLQTIV